MNHGQSPVSQNSGDSALISIICSHHRNTSIDKICHSWSRFWQLMSKMLCVSSCATVSDCEFRVLQVIACSSTYIVQLGRSIQDLVENAFIVPSVQQKSSGLKFSKSRTGSHMTYSCHHNLSLLLSPYMCICGVSLSSIHYNQSCHIYINQRHLYICLIWS
jgi:hypothetical protein